MKNYFFKSVLFRRNADPSVFNKPSLEADSDFTLDNGNFPLPYFTTGIPGWLHTVSNHIHLLRTTVTAFVQTAVTSSFTFLKRYKQSGFTATTRDFEVRKQEILRQVNLLQFLMGIVISVSIIFSAGISKVSPALIFPPLINLIVLYLAGKEKTPAAMFAYFVFFPFFTNLSYIDNVTPGTELFFILYAILSVFFIQQIALIVFCIGLNTVNYLLLVILLKKGSVTTVDFHIIFFLLNHLLAIVIIFYCLYLLKKENAGYQSWILEQNDQLQTINEKVKRQKEELGAKALQLEMNARQLNEMDAFKTRLFSIVSHDLKGPLYALRDLFTDIQRNKMRPDEIMELIPDVVKDLHYATGLTDNLLNWAKSQLNARTVTPLALNVSVLIREAVQQQRLQAELKGIQISSQAGEDLFICADKDMTRLVLRNLLSNAIKFTPVNGTVTVGANLLNSAVEIFVNDTGDGMDADVLSKIKSNEYITTSGTTGEQGTGLGLMLCRDFLKKNNGQLHIESVKGQGSSFSFTLPLAKN
jgi:signal transduction histidine kinase